ncbi:hypothetical protein NL108_006950 [Boleophthalmus pectinirostris]|nr:hypothetical protein NL108_006950 [Boleophthalmus pectinirostris]
MSYCGTFQTKQQHLREEKRLTEKLHNAPFKCFVFLTTEQWRSKGYANSLKYLPCHHGEMTPEHRGPFTVQLWPTMSFIVILYLMRKAMQRINWANEEWTTDLQKVFIRGWNETQFPQDTRLGPQE